MASYTTRHNAQAAQALAGALTAARRGPGAPRREQRHGRLDRRRLAKVGVGDMRVFTSPKDPAPQRLRVTILVDASASMSGWNDRLAMQVCRNLADATDLLPWVSADVVGFTTGGEGVVVFPVWKTGEPTKSVDAYGKIPMSGTEEGYALAYALDEMKESISPREQGLIIIVSDGGPSEPVHVKSVVRACWDEGVPVVSVALNASAQQPLMYGHDNVVYYDYEMSATNEDGTPVPYYNRSPVSNTNGAMRKLARDMARKMGSVL